MPRRRPLVERLLRRLARLLPEEFQADFGGSIDADLADRRRAGDSRRLWRTELPSLVAAVIREHAAALQRDVKYALRTMRRTPGFTAMAVLMLALGTGANAAIFSIVDAVLLRSPFRTPDRIVAVLNIEGRQTPTAAVPVARYRELVTGPGPFSAVAGFTGGGSHVTTASGELRRLEAECVSAPMFEVLGVAPFFGRPFTAMDDRAGASPVMVLSYRFWKALGGSTSIVGSTLVVNQTSVLVIGVMPRFFAGPLSRSDTEAWLPMHRPIAGGGLPGCAAAPASLNVYARLADGRQLEQAGAELGPTVVLSRLHEYTFADIRRQFVALGGAVLCVLLIACFNVGGLQMERTLARRREMAVRLAIGASRGRIVRQLVTESLVLALLAAVMGVGVAWFTLQAIVALVPGNIPYLDEIEINARVLAVTLLVASGAGVIAGLLPLGPARKVDPASDLASGTRVGARQGSWTRRGLIVTQIALSVVVLIGSALMIQTFLTLRPTHPGFDPSGKISTRVSLLADTPPARIQFVRDLSERLRLARGVRDVTFSTWLPLSGFSGERPALFAGTTAMINTAYITSDFFDVMKIPLRAGRPFTALDSEASTPVAIVDEVFAKRIRPDGQVLGERIAVPLAARPKDPPIERQIVGIVAPTRFMGSNTRERPIAWIPYSQDPITFVTVIAESDGRSAAMIGAEMRRAIRELRPNVPLVAPEPMAVMLDRSVADSRFGAWLFGVFAALAVLMTAIGLMTTLGWWVRQRTRELGVRRALGATGWEIIRLVGRQGLILATLGITLGCAIAAGVTRYLQGWIYGITPLDPATFAGCAVLMLLVAACAVCIPVRRATSVDPAMVLKAE